MMHSFEEGALEPNWVCTDIHLAFQIHNHKKAAQKVQH